MTQGGKFVEYVEIEGEKVAHFVINDVQNRYHLSKPSTLKEIGKLTKTELHLKGKYAPDRESATISEPALYIQITGPIDNVKKAIEMIYNVKDKTSEQMMKELETVIPLNMKEAILDSAFNIRQRLVGNQGTYFKYIQNKSFCTVQLKGSNEKDYLGIHLIAPSIEMLKKAEDLVNDLISTTKREYERFVKRRNQSLKSMQSIEQMNNRYYMPPQ
eukprot:NODE_87_length_21935_cov_0.397142.p8 type:complete len:215 gc:universal NODE_87_length_21935_cov_0.397142:6471-7115(+)